MSHNSQQNPRNPSRRPATIAELAQAALDNLWDERRDLKHYLRTAEKYRRDARKYINEGDLESAFIEFARAATLVLEKLPSHRDFHTLLNANQRHNLTLNGQDILDKLSELKPILLERYEKWSKQQQQDIDDSDPPPDPRQQRRTRAEDRYAQAPQQPARSNTRTRGREKAEEEQLIAEELRQWNEQREATRLREQEERQRRDAEDRERQRQAEEQDWQQQQQREVEERERQQRTMNRTASTGADRRKDAAVAAARQAASRPPPGGADYGASRTPMQYHAQNTSLAPSDARRPDDDTSKHDAAVAAARQAAGRPQPPASRTPVQGNSFYVQNGTPSPSDGRRHDEEIVRHQQQQEEMRQREEEIMRKRAMKKKEQDGIAKRQQEAEEAAHATRQNIAANNSGLTVNGTPSSLASTPSGIYSTSTASSSLASTPSSSFYQTPTPTQSAYAPGLHAPTANSRPPSFNFEEVPLIMPLESPTRYEGDSTDSESVHNGWRRGGKPKQPLDYNRTPTRPLRSPSYPPPITTTSPPPGEGSRILYPQLMSQHQKRQGYYPSLNSMFVPTPEDATRSLNAISSSLFLNAQPEVYPNHLLPKPSAAPSSNAYGMPMPTPSSQHQHQHNHSIQYPSYQGPSRPAPPVPQTAPPNNQGHSRSDSSRIIRNTQDDAPILRTVTLPRECLPRFLTLAKVNTNMNMETCGLLLGKDKGSKFVVTTLLIPKQHSTSDTCTMDEEELVLQFTEERSLITLGWIHTHPSQSCFMSSVDLHTHSGFQCMLPESFAVVCAPKSNPNFGIFRLTDPPGLKTVLECTAKEAFHPHPDLPIYTDADKGHVQMKDMSLEIVDLR